MLNFTVSNTLPVIVHTPVTEAGSGSDISITATITDDRGVKGAVLFFKPDNTGYAYNSVDMISVSGNVYSAVIPKEDVTAPAIKYYIRAEDIDGNKTTLPEPVVISIISIEPITVTSPGRGENWDPGTTKSISWTYTGKPGKKVKIELLKNGSPVSTIKSSASIGSKGKGSFKWKIPITLEPGTNYSIKVTCTTNSSVTGTGGIFTVVEPVLTLTSPNGEEEWKLKTTSNITWQYTGNPGTKVKIELLKNGSPVKVIKSSASTGKSGNGLYKWKIPTSLTAGNDYSIRISSTAVKTCMDTSDENFSIQ